MKLGFLGLGMMGMPIVENILAKGESELYFFARRAEVIQKTNALGGKQVKSLKELGKTCDIIFVLLGMESSAWTVFLETMASYQKWNME